ncbi:MAG: RAD55 family ATPase, partial [Candidatus Thorarchaeota archaeon]
MFKETIPGLDKVLVSDIPKGAVIIVTGTAGSLKSAFVYNMLSQYLKRSKDEKGIYVTLEESKQSHMRNMKSLGINIEKNLKVSDLASFRAHIGFEQMDYLDLIMKRTTGSIKALSDPKAEKIGEDNSDSLTTGSKVT